MSIKWAPASKEEMDRRKIAPVPPKKGTKPKKVKE